MKKYLCLLVVFIMVFPYVTFAAEPEFANRTKTRVYIDYTPIEAYTINDEFYINPEELVHYGFDVPAQITEGRTLVPLRAISEGFGAKVVWNEDLKNVQINK